MKRPSGHPGTGKARPPRCRVRWECDSPRSFISSRRSAGRGLGRKSAVSRAVPEPFLSRFSIQMDEFLGVSGSETPKISPPTAHPLAQTSPPPGHDTLMGGGDVWSNGCAVGGDLSGVSGLQTPKNSSIWIEKRLRNGSETARETAEFRPSPRPALLLETMNDRGEFHFHRTRHRGGRALHVSWCSEGRFVRPGSFRSKTV